MYIESVFVRRLHMLVLLLLLNMGCAIAKKDKGCVVRMETSMGVIRIALSDLTPIHRDNFIRLVSEGFYDGVLFHRVIEDFMIQTGDPCSKGAGRDSVLGEGGPGYTLPAEIVFPELFHVRGSVAAAREGDDVNPEYRSSGSQFYIVWGRRLRPVPLKKAIAHLAEKGIELDRFMINDYQMYGGTPHLDGAYTVFGQVIEGLDVVEAIQEVATDSLDRPLEDVYIIKALVEKPERESSAKEDR